VRSAKDDVDVRLMIPGAVVRQTKRFGAFAGYGSVSCEYFTLAAGVDTAPLFEGLDGGLCSCPHWGYVLQGTLVVTDAKGSQERVTEGDLFYMPPGHNVRVEADAEIVMFSPEDEHSAVIDHMIEAVRG
jgi:hypothetical protein